MTRIPLRFLAVLAAALLLASACGGDDPDAGDGGSEDGRDGAAAFDQPATGVDAYPLFVNSEIVVGENRILVGILNSDDAPIGSPDLEVTADLFDLAESATEPVSTMTMDFEWSIEDVTGVYIGHASFQHAGKWGAEVSIQGEGIDEAVKTSFTVAEEGSTPALGADVPASDTLTIDDKPLKDLSTDPHPDRNFYTSSIAQSIEAGHPFVVVFATPKFCTSAVCGPTLDIVKDASKRVSGIDFIHVEVYELPADPSNLVPVASASEWGLPSEPWVFVVDGDGKLTAKYEGVVGASELQEELAKF
jgi:hypothetical protein